MTLSLLYTEYPERAFFAEIVEAPDLIMFAKFLGLHDATNALYKISRDISSHSGQEKKVGSPGLGGFMVEYISFIRQSL
jgi:hypothetical protein